jgi:uncharacterized Zn-binding protein involved in type VI secretion
VLGALVGGSTSSHFSLPRVATSPWRERYAKRGGPISGPGAPNVLIGMLPGSVVGDLCVCVGSPDSIVKGSTTVMLGGKPAVRMGDTTAHGGSVVRGLPTVLIGG